MALQFRGGHSLEYYFDGVTWILLMAMALGFLAAISEFRATESPLRPKPCPGFLFAPLWNNEHYCSMDRTEDVKNTPHAERLFDFDLTRGMIVLVSPSRSPS